MKIHIWGARGSHPHPMTPDAFRDRIKNIVQRIRPSDIQTNEDRERFLGSLPRWLWAMPGGNTPCIEVRLSDNTCLIFDAGSGIIPMSRSLFTEAHPPQAYHMFFSHFHYDHIQGLPFFSQAYIPTNSMYFYSPEADLEYILKDHMQHPYFPVTMEEKMTPNQYYTHLEVLGGVRQKTFFGNAKVEWMGINHPGNSYAYKITEAGKSIIIATDYELSDRDFVRSDEMQEFFDGADILVLDTMYTLGEAIEKFSWGHSSFSLGVEFAIHWKAQKLLLFHHEPQYDDKRLYANLNSARWYAQRQGGEVDIDIAEEGLEIEL